MNDVVIVEALRSPIGRRNGGLSSMHSADLLGTMQRAVVDRSGIDPNEIDQVLGGCITQAGMQSYNVTRTAWLAAGLPVRAAGATVDSACGSSQHAANMLIALIRSGVIDVGVSCGVELMSRVPMGTAIGDGTFGKPLPKSYFQHFEFTTQFEAAERIADTWGITRAEADQFGLDSQQRLAAAWAEDRFGPQIVPIDAPDLGEDGKPSGTTHRVDRDEGMRPTTSEALAGLVPVARPDGVHTAGNSSQITDGAAAVLYMSTAKARELGVEPRARVLDTCLVGSDPVLMLTGPIDATEHILKRNKMTMSDIDVIEINEAFASVVIAWERECGPDHVRVNPNGGAIAHGHPLGGTGNILLTKAIHELERSDKQLAFVTMCCGGGMATGTLIERI